MYIQLNRVDHARQRSFGAMLVADFRPTTLQCQTQLSNPPTATRSKLKPCRSCQRASNILLSPQLSPSFPSFFLLLFRPLAFYHKATTPFLKDVHSIDQKWVAFVASTASRRTPLPPAWSVELSRPLLAGSHLGLPSPNCWVRSQAEILGTLDTMQHIGALCVDDWTSRRRCQSTRGFGQGYAGRWCSTSACRPRSGIGLSLPLEVFFLFFSLLGPSASNGLFNQFRQISPPSLSNSTPRRKKEKTKGVQGV